MRADRRPGTTVVVSPPPTPNGPLHIGHLAGPYLAADVAARAARHRGERVLTICGLDDNQNYVLARARQEGDDPRAVRSRHADLITGVFRCARIGHDVFTEPMLDPGYRSAIPGLLGELVASGALPVTEWTTPTCPNCPTPPHHAYLTGRCGHCGGGCGGGTCESCGGYTPGTDLMEPTCTRCGAAAEERTTVRGPVLRLEEHRLALEAVWLRATLPPRARELAVALLDGPLPTVPFSYPTDWGIELPSFPGHRVDVWAEMGLGYLYAIGWHFRPGASGLAQLVAGWREVAEMWTFLGIDNVFYYLALFPALFSCAGLPPEVFGGLVVNEFYRLDGAKFSTSRNHAVWAHGLLERTDPGALRAFLSWDRPDSYPTDFTLERYRRTTAAWSRRPAAGDDPIDGADLDRAAHALTLRDFDLALAARCLLRTGSRPSRHTEVLGLITGHTGDAPSHAGRELAG